MGLCTKEEHRHFLEVCPEVEKFIVDGGIQLIKYWLEVSNNEQKRRFEARINDPLRHWKLSPMDLPLRSRDYSHARDAMLKATDTKFAPWVYSAFGQQEAGALKLHLAPPESHSLRKDAPRKGEAAQPVKKARL